MKAKLLLVVIAVLVSGCSWFEDKRVVVKPEISVQQKEARYKVIEKFVIDFGKKRQREICLSAQIEQISKCFECHDLWKEWEQEQLRKESDGTQNIPNQKSGPGSRTR